MARRLPHSLAVPALFRLSQGAGQTRCGLIEDPTLGSGRRGPVSAGAVTKGPEQEASPAFYGSGVEGGYSPE